MDRQRPSQPPIPDVTPLGAVPWPRMDRRVLRVDRVGEQLVRLAVVEGDVIDQRVLLLPVSLVPALRRALGKIDG